MKTESNVAQENLKSYKMFHITFKALTQHKESCERFLEFLQTDKFSDNGSSINEKIGDLQQAIKLYEEKSNDQ